MSRASGVNDYLDRDGSRTPIEFPCGLGLDQPILAQVVQAATKWKRMALRQSDCKVGEGICTDMRAVRKDSLPRPRPQCLRGPVGLGEGHHRAAAHLDDLKATVCAIWGVIKGAETYIQQEFPKLRTTQVPDLPDELTFLHAEEILDMYLTCRCKARRRKVLQHHPAIFIVGIGAVLKDGYPHEMRAADYDDLGHPTVSEDGRLMHGLNGDILVWNSVTRRRHELSSMGIRVTKESLRRQLELSGQLDFLKLPYHQAILNDKIPVSVGGGIGQSRTVMLLLRKAHLGEVSVSVWPRDLNRICEKKNIHVLE